MLFRSAEWYDSIHVPDVLSTPGFVSARRYKAKDLRDGRGMYLAIYEILTDDIEATLTLSFVDAAKGLTTTLHLTADASCSTCTGSGAKPGNGAKTSRVHSQPLPTSPSTPQALAASGRASTGSGSQRRKSKFAGARCGISSSQGYRRSCPSGVP